MDITTTFRTALEVVKKQKRDLPQLSPELIAPPEASKPKIFPTKKSAFYTQAADLRQKITKLRNFLGETKTSYLSIGKGVLRSWRTKGEDGWSNNDTMTDLERDQVDGDVQKIIQACQQQIFEFEQVIQSSDAITQYPQLKQHLENIQESLGAYLKEVTGVYSEMRAVRVSRTLNYKNLSKITQPGVVTSTKTRAPTDEKKPSSYNQDLDEADKPRSSSLENLAVELSPEEIQMYEEENNLLLNQLNTMSEEVNQIETSVIKVAQLQEVFTEKVLLQDKDVNKISDLIVGTTENVRDGNEQIRQSIQKNADFRAWVLFFIIVMSFSLLFLDWYND